MTTNSLQEFSVKSLQAELLARRKNDGLLQYVPACKPGRNQEKLHRATNFGRLASGGNQSGKSIWTAAEMAFWLRGLHPYLETPAPANVWLVSASYQTVDQGVYPHLFGRDRGHLPFIPDSSVLHRGPKISGYDIPSYFLIRHDKGGVSRLDFHSSQGADKARERMTSAAIDLVAIDEEIDSGLKDELMARLLLKGGKIIASATLVAGQPWLTEMEEKASMGDSDYGMVRLRTDENEWLDQAHIQRMLRELSPEERDVRIYGKSKRMSGLVYPTWEPDIHMVDGDPSIISGGRIVCSIDPGYRTTAGIWVWMAPDGHDYIVGLMYENYADLRSVYRRIKEIERYLPVEHAGDDPLTWYDTGGETWNVPYRIIDRAEMRHTVTGEPGWGDLLATDYDLCCEPSYAGTVMVGIEAARRWLAPSKRGIPQLRVMKGITDVESWMREISGYKFVRDTNAFKAHSKKVEPLRRNNHLMDCFKNLAFVIEDLREGHISLPPKDADPLAQEIRKAARTLMDRRSAEDAGAEVEAENFQKVREREMGLDIYGLTIEEYNDMWD